MSRTRAARQRVMFYESERSKQIKAQQLLGGDEIIEDGFGGRWVNYCDACDKHGTMEVVRPGKVQCHNCGM